MPVRRGNGAFQWASIGKPAVTAALVATLGLVAGGLAGGCCKPASAASEESTRSPNAVKVETVSVASRSVPRWLNLTGQLKGSRDADVAANANGKVVKTLVERGDVVKAGQAIATIDTRAAALNFAEARASAESAAASAENAKMNCDRFRALAEQGAISQFEYDARSVQCKTSDLAVSAARARAALAGQTVGDGVIRAPFAGSIAERYVDVGEFVRSDSRVVTLVNLTKLRLEFTIPETQIAAARPGALVRFTVSGFPDKRFQGSVKYVSAQVRPTTRDVVAEAVIDTADVDLRPGMFAAIELAAGEQTLPIVNRRSLLERDGRFVAFATVEGRLEERIIQLGESFGEEIAVLRGVNAGESVVVAPSRELKNGQRVL
ncbi:MAG: efflux RND transporter periplasmic adaptor subunit [Polyangiaceae bacterium]